MTRFFRAAAVTFAALSVTPRVAAAYDLSSSSAGAQVHWAAGVVTFVPALSPSPDGVDPAAATAIAGAAVATWQASMPDDAVSFAIGASATAAPRADDGVNTIRWALDDDDPDVERGVLGRTFAIYRTSTGELHDADIVFNAADFDWTTDVSECGNEYDFESALAHELGHAIGLAHSVGHPDATMFATGDACESTKRDLDADDVAAIAELYAAPEEGGGCSASGSGASGGALLVLGAALLVGRRRRHAAVAACAVLAAAPDASAGQLRRLEVDELAAHAVLVVRGRVLDTVTTPALETESTVVVDECLAGTCPDRVVVQRRGGEYGDRGLWVDGEAVLGVGDEVVLYLRVDARRAARVVGGVQGAWRMERGMAVRDLRGHQVRSADGWKRGAREALSLDAIRASLDASVRATR